MVISSYRAKPDPCGICGRETHMTSQHVSTWDYARLCDRCWIGWCREKGQPRCLLAHCPCGCKGGGGG